MDGRGFSRSWSERREKNLSYEPRVYYQQNPAAIPGGTGLQKRTKSFREESAYESASQSTDNEPVFPITEHRTRRNFTRRPDMSAQAHVASLLHERNMIMEEQARFRDLQQYYIQEMTKAMQEQKSFSLHSPQFQDSQHVIADIMQQLYSNVGTPQDAKEKEKHWRFRLMEIEDKLRTYQKSTIHPPSSPESQVSGIPGTKWSSPPMSTTDSMTSFSEPGLMPESVLHHHIHTGGGDSSPFDNGSESTSSSGHRKDHLFRGSYSDHGGYHDRGMYLPHTGSTISTDENELDPNVILASMSQSRPTHLYHHHHNRRHYHPHPHPHRRHQPIHYPLSQDSDYPGPYASSSALLSQHSGSYYKPSSPASSSETEGSLASSVNRRLKSGPASPASSSIDLSQTTNSSTRSGGYNYRLPRPPHMGNGYGSSLYPRQYPTVLEVEPHMIPSDVPGMVPPGAGKAYHSPSHRPMPAEQAHHGPESAQKAQRRKGATEEKSERDPFSVKLDMVMSVMSAFSITSKSDADAVKLILALSQSSETSSVMSESLCIEHLVQILHKIKQKGSKEHAEIRIKAAEALRNIIKANSSTRRGKSELAVLNSLERVRNHCEQMFHFIYNYRGPQQHIDPMVLETLQKSCYELMATLRKLFKYSGEKEFYRSAVLNLGGLQAMAEILVVDYHLPLRPDNQKVICHSPDIIAITITTLINLTYGDANSKLLLCNFPDFLHALISHMYSSEEAVLSKGAQVLRNLSCKAVKEIKDSLLKCNAVDALMAAIDNAEGETTTQHITSALWNISAHSIENRHHICRTRTGISTLVSLLSYHSPSGATVVVENVGGILRNLSNVISLHEDYRKQFREAGGLGKLVQHLKSKNRTVLSNATGILWNLSARCPEDQKLLWDLGCVPLLDVLQTSPAKNIGENARAALRNLLAFGQSNNIGALGSRLRRPSSKSTTTLPVSHLSQASGMDYELQSGRRSAPYHSTTTAIYPPPPAHHNADLRCKSEAGSHIVRRRISDEESSNEDYVPRHSNLKFSRVGSAPQPHNEEEWRNYRPERGMEEMPGLKVHKCYSPHHAGKRRAPKQVIPQRSRTSERPSTHSLSQSESYDMSSASELQSVSAASYGLSPHFQVEHARERPEAGLEYDDLEVDLEYYERYGHDSRTVRTRSMSSPPSIRRYLSQPDPEARDHFTPESMIHPLEKYSNASTMSSPPTPSYLQAHRQGSEETRSNTDSLALDGTILDDQRRASPTRQASRNSSRGQLNSPTKDLST